MNLVRLYVAVFYREEDSYKIIEKNLIKKLGQSDYITSKIKCQGSLTPKEEMSLVYIGDFIPLHDLKYVKLLSFNKEVNLKSLSKKIKQILSLKRKLAKLRSHSAMICFGYVKHDQVVSFSIQPSPYRVLIKSKLYAQIEMIYKDTTSTFEAYPHSWPISSVVSCITFFNDVRRLHYKQK